MVGGFYFNRVVFIVGKVEVPIINRILEQNFSRDNLQRTGYGIIRIIDNQTAVFKGFLLASRLLDSKA
jgi:hypothetical protein